MIGVRMHEEMQDLIKNPAAEQNDHPSLSGFPRRTRAEGEETWRVLAAFCVSGSLVIGTCVLKEPIDHWAENTSSEPVVLICANLFKE